MKRLMKMFEPSPLIILGLDGCAEWANDIQQYGSLHGAYFARIYKACKGTQYDPRIVPSLAGIRSMQ